MQRLYHADRPWVRSRVVRTFELYVRLVLAQGERSDDDSSPYRPSIPPVLLCALLSWGVCAALYSGLYYLTTAFACAALVIGACGLTASALIAVRKGRVFLVAAILGVSLGLGSSGLGALTLRGAMDAVQDGSVSVSVVELLDDAREGSYSSYATAYAYADNGERYKVRLYLEEKSLPRYGAIYEISGTIEPVKEDYGFSSWQSGIAGTLSASSAVQVTRTDLLTPLITLRNSAIDAIEGASGNDEAKCVLEALVCGYRVGLYDSEAYTDFKIAGLAHLVAVSGAHLSLVAALIATMLSSLRASRRATALLQSALILGFLVFTAFPASAVRAAVMSVASLLAFGVRRRASSLNSLGVCLLFFVVLDPQASVSVSLALSASSVLGILLFSRLFQSWLRDLRLPALRKAGESVSATFAASVLSTPLSACLFNQVPLVSPLANLIAAPLFTGVCTLGVCATLIGVAFPALGAMLIACALAFCELMCQAIHLVASLPFASIPFVGNVALSIVATTVAASLLWRFWPRVTFSLLAVLLASTVLLSGVAVTVGQVTSGLELVALDVGQGDALLVRDGSSAVLVDTGREDQKLLAALATEGVYRLDAVVLTHGDEDHVGSLEALKGIVAVDRVVVCADAKKCDCENCKDMIASASALVGEENVIGVSQGDELVCGRAALRVIWPKEFTDEGGNADSLCLLVDFDADGDEAVDARAFLCGDAEDEQLDKMIDAGLLSSVDIYKVGHHGSRKAIDEQTARILSPKVSLVSVGKNNSYGHPVASTLEALRIAGSAVYRTDEDGDIVCSIGVRSITVCP